MPIIRDIEAQPILDSNGNWTTFTTIHADNGMKGFASVPTGHSVGPFDAKLVGYQKAVELVNTKIAPILKGHDIFDQSGIDSALISLDGTNNKAVLGADTILSVSIAAFNTAAKCKNLEVYKYLQMYFGFPELSLTNFPTPLPNLINGGEHATNTLKFQSFMLAPASFIPYPDALGMSVETYHQLQSLLKQNNLSADVGEEGGFSPQGIDPENACHYIIEAITKVGHKPGQDIFLAIDVSANAFFSNGLYNVGGVLGSIDSQAMIETYVKLTRAYPILYLEDPLSSSSLEAWTNLVASVGNGVEIVGDDLTATQGERVKNAASSKSITGVNIKLNQIGTLSETIDVIKLAKDQNLTVVISHRSGDTAEDVFIADLAVGCGAQYVKSGAPARGERTAKYNRLLDIYHEIENLKPTIPGAIIPPTPLSTSPPKPPVVTEVPKSTLFTSEATNSTP
ncbi:hypothetical protein A3A70_02710 [candidate division WWE3 bacterium RIFCSPLOWO2_01_FULL_42_11]|uniref:Enolase n=1 Tax=candidate division WWE3 bacterium RIFCSPLOWO2_01_FULL_42_11 TaxID=1802627 RepID=A0A1F4VQB9_UNCKA|nr:MAG: hypothetical protein A3A70_02710 [candidate division WWE3 bacterium RIFCSPLOWO2_01_FULL_42_11]